MADETNPWEQAQAIVNRIGAMSRGDLPAMSVAQPAQPNEPRAIIRHFAEAMEWKLAANDDVKGGWRYVNRYDLLRMLRDEVYELNVALNILVYQQACDRLSSEAMRDVLDEAADCANYAMLIADVCGALPPTDERGR